MPLSIKTPTKKGKYDLPAEKTVFKRYLTLCENKKDIGALEALHQQFNQATDLTLEEEQFKDRLNQSIIDIKKEKIPIVEISTAKKPYDINQPAQLKLLLAAIKRKGKKQQQNDLLDIKRQLQNKHTSIQHQATLNIVDKLIGQIDHILTTITKTQNYQPYTILLQDEFLTRRTIRPPTLALDKHSLQKYKSGTLEHYLDKSVSSKKKLGEDNFREVSACFWFDFEKLLAIESPDNAHLHLVTYITLVLQFCSHNSSYYPAQGYGKSRTDECQHPLFYFRSQSEHHYIEDTKRITRSKDTDNRTGCYGKQNNAYQKLLLTEFPASLHTQQLAKIKDDGRLANEDGIKYLGIFLAHVGSRANNFVNWFLAIMTQLKQDSGDPQKRVSQTTGIPQIDKTTALPTEHMVNTLVASCIDAFKQLQDQTKSWAIQHDLFSCIQAHRAKLTNKMASSNPRLQNISLNFPENASFIEVTFYPNFTNEQRDTDNFKQGLTNVLIGFLGGLINYNAALAGQHVFMQRRQSFGFLRPTITDIGSLKARISIGTEPIQYADIILQSLRQFDTLLDNYDFTKGRSSHNELIKQLSQPCENAKGKQQTDKTGNYLLASMRAEDDQWVALLAAQKYLLQAHNKIGEELNDETSEDESDHDDESNSESCETSEDEQESESADEDQDEEITLDNAVIKHAFEEYLQQFIIERVNHSQIAAADRSNISRNGFSFFNSAEAKLPKETPEDILKNNVSFLILQNLIAYVIKTSTEKVPFLDPKTTTYYSFVHIFIKLLHNCQKGVFLLEHLNQYETTHLYAKANLLIENILEYLSLFTFFINLELRTINLPNIVPRLRHAEIACLTQHLNLPEKSVKLFFNDSGEQAIITGIVIAAKQLDLTTTALYCFPGGYYELPLACTELGISTGTGETFKERANIWFIDITQLPKINFTNTSQPFNNVKSVIIDITNSSTLDTLTKLQPTISLLRAKGILVILVNSSLKHEQLGMDKYQSGKTTVILPENVTLKPTLEKQLSDISEEAASPTIAFYHTMMQEIGHERETMGQVLI
jgi:hypothetical protein